MAAQVFSYLIDDRHCKIAANWWQNSDLLEHHSALCRGISSIKQGVGRVKVQGRALLPPKGQARVNLPKMAQDLLAVCCCVCCHHLVLPSYL